MDMDHAFGDVPKPFNGFESLGLYDKRGRLGWGRVPKGDGFDAPPVYYVNDVSRLMLQMLDQ